MKRLLARVLLLTFIAVFCFTSYASAFTSGDFFCSGNNTCFYEPGCAGVEGTSSDSAASTDTVFMLGDSILKGAYYGTGNLKDLLSKTNITAKVDAETSRSIKNIKGQDTNEINSEQDNGLDAVDKDTDVIKDSGAIVIALGTNIDGDTNTYKSLLAQLVTKVKGLNGTAPIYLVNLFSPGISNLDARNKAIADVATEQNAKLIDVSNADIKVGSDKIHPTTDGYTTYSTTLANGLSANASDNTDTATNTCCGDGSATDAAGAKLDGATNGEAAYNYFIGKGLSPAGAAGIIGNMTLESVGVEPERLQNHTSERIPAEKVPAAESGNGYGIVQWTPANKKILAAAKPVSKANSLSFQLDYLWKELSSGYKPVIASLKTADSPEAAALAFLSGFERPRDPGATSAQRGAYARAYYNLATKGKALPSNIPTSKSDAADATDDTTTTDTSTTTDTTDTSDTSCGDASATTSAASGDCSVTAPVNGSVNGSGSEYSQEQLTKIFGNPGTASSHPDIAKNLEKVDFLGHSVEIHKLAAGCLKAVASDLSAAKVNYKIRLMGCYRFDSNNGSSNIGLKSYHTYGVACDINWDKNPFVSGGTASHDMPEAYIKAFHDHGFTWGGNWVSVKDYMHFEFNGIKP